MPRHEEVLLSTPTAACGQDGFGSKRHIGMSIENTCGLLPLRHPKVGAPCAAPLLRRAQRPIRARAFRLRGSAGGWMRGRNYRPAQRQGGVQRANIGKMKAWCEDFLEEFDGTVISEFNRCE